MRPCYARGKAAAPKTGVIQAANREGKPGPEMMSEADRLVLAEHAPPGAVIDDEMNIIQVRGRTAPYLELSPGEPTRNLLRMACEGLIAGLGKAIRTARQNEAAAKEEGFRIGDGGQLIDVPITVIPLKNSPLPGNAISWFFSRTPEPNGGAKATRKPAVRDNGASARLRRELVATKEYLQSIVEESDHTGRTQGGERRGAGGQRGIGNRAGRARIGQRRIEHAE